MAGAPPSPHFGPGPATATAVEVADRLAILQLEAEYARTWDRRDDGIHLLSPPSLTIAGDTARGWVHFQYFDRDRKTGARRQVVGVYAVAYLRTPAGWRMLLRREQAVMEDDVFAGFPTDDRMWGPELT